MSLRLHSSIVSACCVILALLLFHRCTNVPFVFSDFRTSLTYEFPLVGRLFGLQQSPTTGFWSPKHVLSCKNVKTDTGNYIPIIYYDIQAKNSCRSQVVLRGRSMSARNKCPELFVSCFSAKQHAYVCVYRIFIHTIYFDA